MATRAPTLRPLLPAVLASLLFLGPAMAIRCYSCTSARHLACDDPFVKDDKLIKSYPNSNVCVKLKGDLGYGDGYQVIREGMDPKHFNEQVASNVWEKAESASSCPYELCNASPPAAAAAGPALLLVAAVAAALAGRR